MERAISRWLSILLLTTAACKGGGGNGSRDAQAAAAAGFNLDAATVLVRDDKVKNGKDLERALNRRTINKVDLDHDGQVDPIQVVEQRDGDQRTLTLRAIPSGAKQQDPEKVGVDFANIAFTPDREHQRVNVEARYTAPPEGFRPIIYAYPAVWQGDVIVIPPRSFLYWLIIVDRPIFIGTYYIEIHVDYGHYKYKHKHKHK